MYHYLYNSNLKKAKFYKLLVNIESQLNKLGLNGKVIKLGPYTNLEERINQIKFTNKETLVVVGDDELFYKTVNLLGPLKSKPILGYIPTFSTSHLTTNLGLALGEAGVIILANRRIKKLDLGKIGDNFFIDSVKIFNSRVLLEFYNKFKIKPTNGIQEINILNLNDFNLQPKFKSISPSDGVLDIVFISKKRVFKSKDKEINSFFRTKRFSISSLNGKELSLLVDNFKIIKTPVQIGVEKKQLPIIVGKQRLIN